MGVEQNVVSFKLGLVGAPPVITLKVSFLVPQALLVVTITLEAAVVNTLLAAHEPSFQE